MGIRSDRSIELYLTWQAVDEAKVAGTTVIVVDTLRATTTINTMLAHGAAAVKTVADIEEARAAKRDCPALLLAGERGNVPPVGFDGGNSPLEYPQERVAGRAIVVTTTNGTQAIWRCRRSRRLALAALINAQAAGQWLKDTHLDGVIVLAGSEGMFALEDWLAGGAIVSALDGFQWSDMARAAYFSWLGVSQKPFEGLMAAAHSQELVEQGLIDDVRYAAQVDRIHTVAARDDDGWFRVR